MNITVQDKNGKPLKEGDVVLHGTVGAKYRVLNAHETARGETLVQLIPMTNQAWMWVNEKDIELDTAYEKGTKI